MINELKNDYLQISYAPPNVVMQVRKGEEHRQTMVHPFLDGLITKLAKARPKWTLVGVSRSIRTEGPWWVHTFKVYEGREELGKIEKGYFNGSDVYEFDNVRLSSSRQRGYSTRTKDMQKAFKAITKSFGAKTVTERMAEAITAATGRVPVIFGAKRTAFNVTSNAMREITAVFLRENYEAFSAFAKAHGISSETVDDYPMQFQEYMDTLKITGAMDAGEGHIIMLYGSDYVVRTKGATVILTHDELPAHMRRCVGMLKLASNDQHIAGIGMRISDDVMFIMPEDKTNGQSA